MRTALITGSGGAIGTAMALAFASAGYRTVGIDVSEAGPACTDLFRPCDLADPAAITVTLESILAETGGVDVLVNNAGHYQPIAFFDLTADDFDATMAVNVRAIFLLSQGIARHMIDHTRPGVIINVASIAGRLGSPIIPYGTSKAAVIGMTKSLARVLGPHGIRVNAIAPGVVETPMSARVAPEQMRRQLTNIPLDRAGSPAEIAGVATFLASDAASYMSGGVVDVNGGWPC